MTCEFFCSDCSNEQMTSLANGITWCPSCGKVTSSFSPTMRPRKLEGAKAATEAAKAEEKAAKARERAANREYDAKMAEPAETMEKSVNITIDHRKPSKPVELFEHNSEDRPARTTEGNFTVIGIWNDYLVARSDDTGETVRFKDIPA